MTETDEMVGRMTEVSMRLTANDADNAKRIAEALGFKNNKAQAVSFALELAWFFVKKIKADPETNILLKSKDGETHRLKMTELEKLAQRLARD